MGDKNPTILAKFKNGGAIDETNYADWAERIMKRLSENDFNRLTTSKLRGIYGDIMNVYTKINKREDFEAHRGDLQYLKVKMAYEEGREDSVRKFMEATGLRTFVSHVRDYDTFVLYCRYAESLVAYFKFFGGKDR